MLYDAWYNSFCFPPFSCSVVPLLLFLSHIASIKWRVHSSLFLASEIGHLIESFRPPNERYCSWWYMSIRHCSSLTRRLCLSPLLAKESYLLLLFSFPISRLWPSDKLPCFGRCVNFSLSQFDCSVSMSPCMLESDVSSILQLVLCPQELKKLVALLSPSTILYGFLN